MRIALSDLSYVGAGLQRPECVLAMPDGVLWVSDQRGGAVRLTSDGNQHHHACAGGATNGLAINRDGELILADIDQGAVRAIGTDGRGRIILNALNGSPLGAVNFVHFDPHGELWVTVSTRTTPRTRAIEQAIPDGYLLKLTSAGPRLMAQGFCFANEIRFDAEFKFIYLAESAKGRVLRMAIGPDGSLASPQPFGPDPLFAGAIVDGLSFDVEGGLWVTEVTRNGVYRIDRQGDAVCVLEDPEGAHLDFPASIAFGGPDRKTVFLGSIRMTRLACFRSPTAGVPLWHWPR